MTPGEIKTCPHCEGETICKRGPYHTIGTARYSCTVCSKKAGLKAYENHDGVICSVCEGKGSVWIGPTGAAIMSEQQMSPDVQTMRDAMFDIIEKQRAVMEKLNQSLAQEAGMTLNETKDLGALIMEATRSIKRAMKVVGIPVKEPI